MNSKKVIVRPGAPALDKGLDLIEALAAESGGLSQEQIAERVGRSVGDIFRMLGVLEQRRYVSRDPATAEYTLTIQLFRVAAQFPPTKRLQQAAPVTSRLSSVRIKPRGSPRKRGLCVLLQHAIKLDFFQAFDMDALEFHHFGFHRLRRVDPHLGADALLA
jgi:hypothetical protein